MVYPRFVLIRLALQLHMAFKRQAHSDVLSCERAEHSELKLDLQQGGLGLLISQRAEFIHLALK